MSEAIEGASLIDAMGDVPVARARRDWRGAHGGARLGRARPRRRAGASGAASASRCSSASAECRSLGATWWRSTARSAYASWSASPGTRAQPMSAPRGRALLRAARPSRACDKPSEPTRQAAAPRRRPPSRRRAPAPPRPRASRRRRRPRRTRALRGHVQERRRRARRRRTGGRPLAGAASRRAGVGDGHHRTSGRRRDGPRDRHGRRRRSDAATLDGRSSTAIAVSAAIRRKDPTDRGFTGHAARRPSRATGCERNDDRSPRPRAACVRTGDLHARGGAGALMFAPTRYLEWARRFYGQVRFDLATSGDADRPGAELGVPDARACDDPTGWARLRAAIARYNDVPRAEAIAALGHHARALARLRVADLAGRRGPRRDAGATSRSSRIAEGLGAAWSRVRAARRASASRWIPSASRARMTPRTRVVVVTNLHNPSGVRASDETLRAVGARRARRGGAALARRRGVRPVRRARRRRACSAGSARKLAPNVVAVSSLTKCYGLGPQRIGWLLGPRGRRGARRRRDHRELRACSRWSTRTSASRRFARIGRWPAARAPVWRASAQRVARWVAGAGPGRGARRPRGCSAS